ncbi:MAG: RNA methyltransferase [Bacteroidales bacterium]|nr:RNA methyltransferase [Bacteroidales bacterium]MCI6679719.1 RNA methyltransferase [Bacteroides sp.]MDY5890657.1 TrmH family RNA methyltransferase [Candidatus Cryptobacteroides sp.]
MTEYITSSANPKFKRLIALLQKSSERRESALFTVEGVREISHCIEAGYKPDCIFFCPDIVSEETLPQCRHFALSAGLYAKAAYREGTEGAIGVFQAIEHPLSSLHLKDNPLIAVLESVEKPGNLGAVLRTCDAAGADALVICDPRTDLYNPNLIRASIGAVFTVPTAVCTTAQAITFLKSKGIRILTAQLQDSSLYYDCPMTKGTAIVMGTEATGLSDKWRQAADAHIRIPMLGKLDSLNVSVSAAILLYEAVRQRNDR